MKELNGRGSEIGRFGSEKFLRFSVEVGPSEISECCIRRHMFWRLERCFARLVVTGHAPYGGADLMLRSARAPGHAG